MEVALLLMASAQFTYAPAPSMKLKLKKGTHLVHGVRQKTTWFVNNIAKTHPTPYIPVRRRRTAIDLRKSTWSRRDELPFSTETGSIVSFSEETDYRASPRTLRSSKKMKLTSTGSDSDSESEEDFGQPRCLANEDSIRSGLTQYYSAASHVSCLDEAVDVTGLSTIDEDSGIAFASMSEECSVEGIAPASPQASASPCSHHEGGSRSAIHEPQTPCLLAAATPSIILTMPTPQLSQSPVFQPRSPITLAKYVQATSSQSSCPTPAVSTGTLSPVPSIPSCNRCCLAQLEEGIICRACERQWLACKVWYQANDGGRRQHLTEPFIRPAESNANVRAVMGVLGVPGSSATVGLGFGPSFTLKKTLPFKVVDPPARPPCPRCNYDPCARLGNCRRRATPWRHFYRHSLDAVKKARHTVRALLSLSLKSESVVPSPRSWSWSWLPRGGLAFTSPAPPYDSPATSWTTRIAPYRPPYSESATEPPAPSCGSSLSRRQLACVTSGSRLIEHLV